MNVSKGVFKTFTSLSLVVFMLIGSGLVVSADNTKYFTPLGLEEVDGSYALPFMTEIEAVEDSAGWEDFSQNATWGSLQMRNYDQEYKILIEYDGVYAPYVTETYTTTEGDADTTSYFDGDNKVDFDSALALTDSMGYLETFQVPASVEYTAQSLDEYLAILDLTYLVLVDESGNIEARISFYDVNDYVADAYTSEELASEYTIDITSTLLDGATFEVMVSWDPADMVNLAGQTVEVERVYLYDSEGIELAWTNSTDEGYVVFEEYLANGNYSIIYVVDEVEFTKSFEVFGSDADVQEDDDTSADLDTTEAIITVTGIPTTDLSTGDSFTLTVTSDIPVQLNFNGNVSEDYATEFTFKITKDGSYFYSGVTESGIETTGVVEVDVFNIEDVYELGDRDSLWTGIFDGTGLVQTGIGASTLLIIAVAMIAAGGVLFVKGGKRHEEK